MELTMLVKITSKSPLTLPKAITAAMGEVEYCVTRRSAKRRWPSAPSSAWPTRSAGRS